MLRNALSPPTSISVLPSAVTVIAAPPLPEHQGVVPSASFVPEISMRHRNVQPHVSKNEVACYRTERILVVHGGQCTPSVFLEMIKK